MRGHGHRRAPRTRRSPASSPARCCSPTAASLDADLVVLGLGVTPNGELAGDAGAERGRRGALVVDRRQRTTLDGVYAAGDCCESHHLVSGRPVHVALGTVANKQGRVAGINLGGGYATFPGVRRHRHHQGVRARGGPHRAHRAGGGARTGFEAVAATIERHHASPATCPTPSR